MQLSCVFAIGNQGQLTPQTNAVVALSLIQIDDAIMEALENDNLQLQNMSGQKYVQLNPMFQDAVANWQKKLGTVDSVLATWGDVQKKWQALESIFVGSADIRVQLPEDSKRFDVVNADYQVQFGWPCPAALPQKVVRSCGPTLKA